jgi:putative transposase
VGQLCDENTKLKRLVADLSLDNVILDFSRRAKSTDNATIESFNGRFRDECLNVHWFATLEDAQEKIDAFRWDYNENHPHRALKGLSPNEYARRAMTTAVDSPS